MKRSLIFVCLCLFTAAFSISTPLILASEVNPRETPVVKVVRENAQAVVNISTESIVLLRENPYWGSYGSELDYWIGQFFGYSAPTTALKLKSVGSGVIIDKEGVVVTNAHVVNMATSIFVILKDGTKMEGKVVYENPVDDLALVKINPPQEIENIELGQTDDIMIGETVVAIGNPLGLENSVTAGVISGKDREFFLSEYDPVPDGLLQIDAPINPGNSGGALLNLNGELIGINVAVIQNSQSIGFAIPVERVKLALDSYQKNKSLTVRKTPNINSQTSLQSSNYLDTTDEEWDPFAELQRIQNEMDRLIQDAFGWGTDSQDEMGIFETDISFKTEFDMQETEEAYLIEIEMSGINKDNLDIEINKHSITVKGEQSVQNKESSDRGFYSASSYGTFIKSIPVPPDADVDQVETDMQEDKLIIKLPKKK